MKFESSLNKGTSNLDSEDLFSEVLQVVERRLCRDGVDEDEALAVLHVKVSHCCELFLKRVH